MKKEEVLYKNEYGDESIEEREGYDFDSPSESFESSQLSFRLTSFEGPLDLLLELIKKAKVSIQDIKISEITEQYLERVRQLSTSDLENASEFILMAALLLEIKSKALLPKICEDEVDECDSEQLLKQKLEEYKLYKEASLKMREQETVDILFREPDFRFIEKPRISLKDMNKSSLMDALRKMFMKLERRAASIALRRIELDRFTVEEKMQSIVEELREKNNLIFTQLFEEDYTKSEIITTFQALLELAKMEVLRLVQDDVFGEILIYKVLRREGEIA